MQAVAAKVNNDAVGEGQPDPGYQAYLVEGNDVGGIDSGFLVKTPRVTIVDVTQFGQTTTYVEPGGGVATSERSAAARAPRGDQLGSATRRTPSP